MKGRRFILLVILVVALLLIPYSGLSSHRDNGHTPYDQLQDQLPQAFFDSDGDLLRDGEEPIYGTDPADVDSDDDWCPDGVEVLAWLNLAGDLPEEVRWAAMPLGDPDSDGVPNVRDPDSDGDGLLDGWEFENGLDPSNEHTHPGLLPDRFWYYPYWSGDMRDMDIDGMPDDWEDAFGVERADSDDDGDGVVNLDEYLAGTDPTIRDQLYGGSPPSSDRDGDGVDASLERVLGLDPDRADSDNDGLGDGDEMYVWRTNPFDPDSDGDLLFDGAEARTETSPVMADTDGDGIRDPDEVNTDPTVPDTDKDLIPDKEEEGAILDSDGDGLPDSIERASEYGNGASDPFDPDTDGDGLSDGQEDANRNGRREGNDPFDRNSDWRSGGETDPTIADTDGGGMNDQTEITFQRDPLMPGDDRIDVNPPNVDPPPIDPPTPTPRRVNIEGWGRVLLVLLAVMFIILLLAMLYNTATTEEDFLEDVLEALEAGERVLYDISITDDVREAIFTAYRKFLAVMEAYGHSKGDPSTAREFAAQVRQVMEVDAGSLHEFTTMFEVARYSDHPLDLGHRDRALAAFQSVRESVSASLGPPDRPIAGEEDTRGGIWGLLRRARGKT